MVRFYGVDVHMSYIYLHHAGLAGDNDLQNAEIGSIADFIVDIGKSCENVMKETDEARKACAYISAWTVELSDSATIVIIM